MSQQKPPSQTDPRPPTKPKPRTKRTYTVTVEVRCSYQELARRVAAIINLPD